MLYQEMTEKVQKDLNIANRRARCYVSMFSNIYAGRKEAITDIKASYTDNGKVQITYTINGKSTDIVLGNESPYAHEMAGRKRKTY